MISEESKQVVHGPSVQHILRSEPAFARNANTVTDIGEAGGAVGVGGDWDTHAALSGIPVQTPIEIEAMRIAVELDCNTELACPVDDGFEIGHVALALQKDTASRVAED